MKVAPTKDLEFLRWFPCAINDLKIAERSYPGNECKDMCDSWGRESRLTWAELPYRQVYFFLCSVNIYTVQFPSRVCH